MAEKPISETRLGGHDIQEVTAESVVEERRRAPAQQLQTFGGPPSVERWGGHDADVATVAVYDEAVSDLDLVQKVGEGATGLGCGNASLLGFF